MPEVDALLHRRYRIKQELGRGGMGAVYKAEDTRLDNAPVAVKETFFGADEPELRQQFEREATVLARLHHRSLPGVRDHFIEGSRQFLVMEFVAGDDLAKLLDRQRKAFDVAQVMAWADTLLDALDYIHTQYPPVIHRDIKPENLKLTPRGDLYLLDFGLVKEGTTPTRAGKSLHAYTLDYAPPEQITGSGTDARSDLYSLAATLYHLVTNRPPADARLREIQVLSYSMPDPLKPAHLASSLVPFALAAMLSKAMSLEPARRYQSAAEMREALSQVQQSIADQQRQREEEQRWQELSRQRDAQAQREREEAARLAAEQRQEEQVRLRELEDRLRREEEARCQAEAKLHRRKTVVETSPQKARNQRRAAIAGAALLAAVLIGWLATRDWGSPNENATNEAAGKDAMKAADAATPTPRPTAAPTPALTEVLRYEQEFKPGAGSREFRFRFTPRQDGYLYLIAPDENKKQVTLLTNRPPPEMGVTTNRVQAGQAFVFPQGREGWLQLGGNESSSKLTLIFSRAPMKQSDFFSARQVRLLTAPELRKLDEMRRQFGRPSDGGVITTAVNATVVAEITARQK